MAPRLLNPVEWLSLLDGMPRVPAAVVVAIALTLLALGLRWFKLYVRLGVGLAGWIGGMALAKLMHVTDWYVALPSAAIAVGVVWPITQYLGPVLIGVVSGAGVGTLVANGLGLVDFWLGFAGGFFVGVTLAVLAARFTVSLFCAAIGTLAIISGIGAVVRATDGVFAPGAYVDYPVVYVIVGAFFFVGAMIAQVALEPEAPMPMGSKERYT